MWSCCCLLVINWWQMQRNKIKNIYISGSPYIHIPMYNSIIISSFVILPVSGIHELNFSFFYQMNWNWNFSSIRWCVSVGSIGLGDETIWVIVEWIEVFKAWINSSAESIFYFFCDKFPFSVCRCRVWQILYTVFLKIFSSVNSLFLYITSINAAIKVH